MVINTSNRSRSAISSKSPRTPTLLEDGNHRVMCEVGKQRNRRALVKQHLHHTAPDWRLCCACSSTASTCSRVTPGNQRKKSSMHAPSSRFSKSAFTGTRDPRKTQAPLTFPGTRSTDEQLDQSNIQMRLTENQTLGKAAGGSNGGFRVVRPTAQC